MSGDAQWELKKLAARKRRVYLTALACGVLIFVLSWLTRDPTDTFAAILYPVFAVLLAALIPMVWSGFLPLEKLEARMVEVLTAIIMTRLFWSAQRSESFAGQLFGMEGGNIGQLVCWLLRLS